VGVWQVTVSSWIVRMNQRNSKHVTNTSGVTPKLSMKHIGRFVVYMCTNENGNVHGWHKNKQKAKMHCFETDKTVQYCSRIKILSTIFCVLVPASSWRRHLLAKTVLLAAFQEFQNYFFVSVGIFIIYKTILRLPVEFMLFYQLVL
jgi:hypothetical protein